MGGGDWYNRLVMALPPSLPQLITTRFLFTFAVQMQAVIVGWQIYELTHDPLALGLIGLAEAVPAIGLALWAGYMVDRGRPLRIYRRVLIVSLLSSVTILASHIFDPIFGASGQIFALYLASFITGVARSFSQPSIFAIVPRLVPRDDLPRVSAYMGSTMQIARIAGPALGGIFYGFAGMRRSIEVVCLLLAVAVACISTVRTHLPAPERPAVPPAFRKELLSGLSYVLRHPILVSAMSLDMISVLFGGATAVLPIYASEILMIGPKGLGLLRAAPAIGAALGNMLLTRIELRPHAGRYLLCSVVGFGTCILVFAVSTSFYLSAVALALSGAFDSVSMLIRTLIVQLASPHDMRGRISAVNSMFIGSSNEIGELESGVAAKFMGLVPSVVFGGVMCLITVGAVAFFAKPLRKLDLNHLHANEGAA